MLCDEFPQVSVSDQLFVTSKHQLAALRDALDKYILYPLVAFPELSSLSYNVFKKELWEYQFRKVAWSPSTQIVRVCWVGTGGRVCGVKDLGDTGIKSAACQAL